MNGKSDLDISRYVGKWFEIRRSDDIFQRNTRCSTQTYEDRGSYISIQNRAIDNASGEVISTDQTATVPDNNRPDIWLVKRFPGGPAIPYLVLDSDYETYSVVVSCTDILRLFHSISGFILSRESTLDGKTVSRLTSLLATNGVTYLANVTQDCG
ncbi:apolipoprotein D-like isoform X2 [Panonychus citri]|nr:apolipoprotein D-like isoform X2 [Panonychus citri]XP_053201137.1 apolipoprotein D-like isoform X2 [Panonychus citri]